MLGKTTRQQYLDAVVHEMLQQGRTDLPLVVLAEAAGTSDRMLVYYFKTRDGLLVEALQAIREGQRRKLAAMIDAVATANTPYAGLVSVLRWVVSEDNAADVRLFFGAAGEAFRGEEPSVAFHRGVVTDWVLECTAAGRRLGADDHASLSFGTVLAATAQSLAADRLATGDTDRIDSAIEAAAASLVRILLPAPEPADHLTSVN